MLSQFSTKGSSTCNITALCNRVNSIPWTELLLQLLLSIQQMIWQHFPHSIYSTQQECMSNAAPHTISCNLKAFHATSSPALHLTLILLTWTHKTSSKPFRPSSKHSSPNQLQWKVAPPCLLQLAACPYFKITSLSSSLFYLSKKKKVTPLLFLSHSPTTHA